MRTGPDAVPPAARSAAGRGAALAALGDVGERRVGGVRGVDERRELAQPLGVAQHRGPLVLVVVDVAGHVRVEVGGDAERVVDDDLADAVEPALVLLLPGRGALQAVGGADVVHEVAVDDADGGLVVDVLDEQLGVPRGETAVAADVDVPALARSR